ncbi:hypothetical protein THAOC_10439, partial [Thalassiosira oceanica]
RQQAAEAAWPTVGRPLLRQSVKEVSPFISTPGPTPSPPHRKKYGTKRGGTLTEKNDLVLELVLTLQTCGGGLRLGRVKMIKSRAGTAACIGRAGLLHSVECVSVRGLGFLRSIGRNKLFLFLSAAAVGGSRTESSPSCWRTLHHKSTPTPTEFDPVYVERRDDFEIASDGTQCRALVHLNEDSVLLLPRGISFQLTCFTLLVTGRNPFGGTLGDDGDPAGPAQGRAVLACPGPVGPLALCWGPFHLSGQRSVYEVGATQRNGSITCFSRQEGWTYFCPKRKKSKAPKPFKPPSHLSHPRIHIQSVHILCPTSHVRPLPKAPKPRGHQAIAATKPSTSSPAQSSHPRPLASTATKLSTAQAEIRTHKSGHKEKPVGRTEDRLASETWEMLECSIGVPETNFLFNAFHEMKSLKELSISYEYGNVQGLNIFDDVVMAGYIPSLSSCTGMQKLKLEGLRMSTYSCTALSAIFPQMDALLELDLGINLIGDDNNNKIGLARGLSLLRFEKLSLMGNTLSLGGPHVIAASLANPDCRLEELDLYETNMETREWQPSNKPGEQSQTYSHIIGT